MTEPRQAAAEGREAEGRLERDYLHFAFDRLAVGINTIGSGGDQ